MTFWQHFISNSGGPVEGVSSARTRPANWKRSTPIRNVVVRVAEMLRPAVVNLRGGRGQPKAPAPASCSRPMAFC